MTDAEAARSSRAVVVGAGTMGAGIAAALAGAGYAVDLVDVDGERAAAVAAATPRVTARGAIAEVAPGADLAIEAVPERLELKRRVLAELERRRPVLLASNTSALSIGALAAGLQAPERLVGLHFFNPVARMALVEVVVADATSAAARGDALAVVHRLEKEPVVVRDVPGFATSRLGVALALEAMRMVEQGVADPGDIDRAIELGYRHPVGPLRLTDIVGLDVRLDIAEHLRAAYGERFAPPALLRQLVADGRLGRKTGHGFYRWRERTPDGTT